MARPLAQRGAGQQLAEAGLHEGAATGVQWRPGRGQDLVHDPGDALARTGGDAGGRSGRDRAIEAHALILSAGGDRLLARALA